MIIANFENNETVKYVSGLYQYNKGQILRITGLNLPQIVEIDFALEETGSIAKREVGTTENGITEVQIPNYFLINNDIGIDYTIYAFVYITNNEVGETVKVIKLQVKSRSKPENVEIPEDKDPFQEVINTVGGFAKESKRWAIGDENVPGSEKDNAKYYSEESKKIEENVRKEGGKFLTGIAEENKKADKNIEALGTSIKAAESASAEIKKNADEAVRKEGGKFLTGIAEENKKADKNIEALGTSIKAAESASAEIKKNADEAVENSGTAIKKVNESIKNAEAAKDAADTATLETNKATEAANTTKTKLDNAATQANELKDALDKSIGEVAKDATGLLILNVLQKGSDLLGQIAKIVEETAGKAGSLNGFGLNLLEDGSVALTYTNPETNLLEASAIFPKDSTAKKLDQALGEINESLKIIALREGGKV